MQKEGYLPPNQRKKILFICDDIRMHSGVATMSREIVLGTAHHYNWVSIAAAINHPEAGKRMDLSEATNQAVGTTDASVVLYPNNGYGNAELIRSLIKTEKPDAIFFFTDPRYYDWLFAIENEIRKQIPMIYINIWDDLPAPLYNRAFYESCDTLLAISKQTKNINEMVLGAKAKDKIITYVPHGINEKVFYPIDSSEEMTQIQLMKSKLFNDKKFDFTLLFNSRNIRRKCISDLLAAHKLFLDSLPKEKADKIALILHTQPIDDNGTDLYAVRELLFGKNSNVFFSDQRLEPKEMNLLYNIADAVVLPTSNEGWGLALTEAMMAGKMIIANVTGGMQDQMRFTDENGKWIDFTPEFPSNHFGKYKKHGKWVVPVFPNNMSLVGSPTTPYIWDDKLDFRELATAIQKVYEMSPETRKENGLAAREWVKSDESGMSARVMCKNIIKDIDLTLNTFKPRKSFEFIKTEEIPALELVHLLTY
jgi:glycosyltransferase involved in cell wall biosynthesis